MKFQPDPYSAGAALLARSAAPAPHLHADITLVIGGTRAMEALCRRLAPDVSSMPRLFAAALPEWAQQMPLSLRMRAIHFRDAFMDTVPFLATPFYDMPRRCGDLSAFLDLCSAGGGSPAKSAMEALHMAIQGSWTRKDGDRRHIILLLTDCPAYLPEEPMRRIDPGNVFLFHRSSGVAEPLPETMDRFRRQWRDGLMDIDNWNSRLCIVAPQGIPWDRMAGWPRTRLNHRMPEEIYQMTAADLMKLCGSLV